MLRPEQIEALAEFDGQESKVLSVYLDLEATTQPLLSYRIAFGDLVKTARTRLAGPALTEFSNEADRVQAWLETQVPPGQGLAIFSCAARSLWRSKSLAVRVPDHLAFEPRPDVAPLLRIVDEHERFAVAVVDKERARIFGVFAGEIEETDHFRNVVSGRHVPRALSPARGQRHHEAHVYWHLERVARRLADLHRRRRFDRLILAGSEEPTHALRRLLPRALAPRVVAVIPAAMFASGQEILQDALEVERGVEQEAEDRLLRELQDLAGPRGRSVTGLRPTLVALGADLVQTLVVAHGARGGGSECPGCERLDPGRLDTCPGCGGPMRPLHDIFHRAMQQAVERSGSAEVLHGPAERRLMDLGGGMGALLRSRSRMPQRMTANAQRAQRHAGADAA